MCTFGHPDLLLLITVYHENGNGRPKNVNSRRNEPNDRTVIKNKKNERIKPVIK